MKYLCLRNCFVQDVYHQKGNTYELADSFPIYEKNFKLVPGQPEPEPTTTNVPEKPRELKPGEYLCGKCNSIHRETSKIGKRHLQYKQG